MKYFTIAILFAIAAFSRATIKLPNYIKPCRAKDSSCLKNLLEELKPHFVQGIPEFNLSSIEPWIIPKYSQSNIHSSKLSYYATVINMTFEGLSNFSVLKFDIDLDRYTFDLKLLFPQIVISGHKTVSGVGFGISVNGSGISRTNFTNLTVTFSLNAREYLKNEKVYLKWKEGAIMVSYNRVAFDHEVPFEDGNNHMKILDIGNDEYPDVLHPQIQNAVKNTLGKFVLQTINFVHETYPRDVLHLAP